MTVGRLREILTIDTLLLGKFLCLGKIGVYGRGCLQEDVAHGGPAENDFLRTFLGERSQQL